MAGRQDERQDGVPVAAAAARLGLSPGAVRKRLQRGALPGRKVGAAWHVDAAALPNIPQGTAEHGPRPDSDRTPVPSTAYAQLAAVRDEWLSPLITRIGALEREAGRLTAELAAAERLRRVEAEQADQLVALLEAELDRLRAALGGPRAGLAAPVAGEPSPLPRRLLGLLRGRLRGG